MSNEVPLLTGSSLIPVSDDETDESTTEYTSDEDDQNLEPSTLSKMVHQGDGAPDLTRTIHYGGGGGGGSGSELGIVELSGLFANVIPSKSKLANDSNIIEIETTTDNNNLEASDDNGSSSENDEQQEVDGNNTDDDSDDDGDDDGDDNDVTNEVSAALAGIDLSTMGVKELRSLVSQHKLATNPTKLRKNQLLHVLSAAKE